jgi:hypothetical protein
MIMSDRENEYLCVLIFILHKIFLLLSRKNRKFAIKLR